MSVVKFLCPNGHSLTAPQNLIGKHGKCPKCNTAFVIPAPESDEEPAVPSLGSGKHLATGGGSNISGRSGLQLPSQGGSSSRSKSDVFVFLCPNGHKLNGPPSLKGKLGQCPHCGARFQIPADDETEEPPPEMLEGAEIIDESPAGSEEVVDVENESPDRHEGEPPFDNETHPLAHIVTQLWYHKGEEGEVELFLPEGEIMQPEYYSTELSARDFGVFATREGSDFTLTVVPWASVRRVAVRKVGRLPGTFGE